MVAPEIESTSVLLASIISSKTFTASLKYSGVSSCETTSISAIFPSFIVTLTVTSLL